MKWKRADGTLLSNILLEVESGRDFDIGSDPLFIGAAENPTRRVKEVKGGISRTRSSY
jgi:hypothetical protein